MDYHTTYSNIKNYSLQKKQGYKESERKDLSFKKNNNSADYIMPSFAVGCPVAKCTYCYVARHNNFGNPLKLYTNIQDIIEAAADFYQTLPSKYPKYSNQQDEWSWVLELGESTDLLSPNLIEYANLFMLQMIVRTGFKTTFATKLANEYSVSKLAESPRHQQCRIRVSLMPQVLSDLVEPGTAKIKDRIKAIKLIYKKGYQCHINFSPVIIHDNWVQNYIDLFQQIDAEFNDDTYISHKIKQQLACEVIFLTHHPKLHESNMLWNPKAEELQWAPEIQEFKTNNRGASDILRYKMEIKKPATLLFNGLIKKFLPYCRVRYMF